MVLVSMDVAALREDIARLTRFTRDARDRWPEIHHAAAQAQMSVYRTAAALDQHLDTIDRVRQDLTARVDLMEVANGADTGSTPQGVLTLEMPLGDSLSAVRILLGQRLAHVASGLALSDPLGVQALSERLSEYLDQPEVMCSFYEKLGPSDLLLTLARAGRGYSVSGPLSLLLKQFKRGLQTADAAWLPAQREAFAAGMVDATVAAAEVTGSSIPAALTYLLHDATYSTEFLDAAATGLDTFERSRPAGALLLWDDGTGTSWSAMYTKGQWPSLGDPVAALMSALANNPTAAFEFFAGTDTHERAAYYLQTRPWNGGMGPVASAVDTAATAFYRQDDPRAEQSAWLASTAVEHFGAREDITPDAAPALGHLLAVHLRGVRQVTSGTRGTWGVLPAETRHGAVVSPPIAEFSQGTLLHVLGEVLVDPDALTWIATAMNALSTEELNYGAAHWTPQDGTALDSAVAHSSRLTGFLLGATQASQDAALADQDASAKALIGFGRDAAAMIPVAGTLAQYGFGKALDALQEDAASRWASTLALAQDDQARTLEAADTNLKVTVAAALMQHGHMLTDNSSLTADGKMTDPAGFPWMRHERLDLSVLNETSARDRMLVWASSVDAGPMLHYIDLIDGQSAAGRNEHDRSSQAGGDGP